LKRKRRTTKALLRKMIAAQRNGAVTVIADLHDVVQRGSVYNSL